jgi:type VI secretion system protein ImpH
MEKMESHGWRSDRSLRDQLYLSGHRFGFYQAVRLIESDVPEKTPMAEGSVSENEPVRFTAAVSQDFPASEIWDIVPGDTAGASDEMTVNFMGLAGCLGPLPAPYTELILERLRRKDKALKDFLDIFNHRLISLLYRVRKNPPAGF